VISTPYQSRISGPADATPPFKIILVIAPTLSERIGASWGGAERNAAERIAVMYPARDGASVGFAQPRPAECLPQFAKPSRAGNGPVFGRRRQSRHRSFEGDEK
jgi:hypothetical protein